MESATTPLPLPSRLSPSGISALFQCPLKFKYTRIDKLVEPSSEAQVLGLFVHAILEALFRLSPQKRTLEQARLLAGSLWNSKWAKKTEELRLSPKAIHTFRWQAWWCVENFFKLENPTAIKPRGLEYKVVGSVGGVPLIGYIDRWNLLASGEATVTDYKTGKVPTKPEFEEEKILQVTIYALMLEDQAKVRVKESNILYLKDGRRASYDPANSRDFTINKVMAAWGELRQRCEAGDFPPSVSPLCAWCSFKNTICPAWNK